jgi:hypothetical protein
MYVFVPPSPPEGVKSRVGETRQREMVNDARDDIQPQETSV